MINNIPLVSVILNSYNYEEYVQEAIRSVLCQTYPNIELIIVDDGSSDGSRDIIEETTADAPISVITIFKDNAGQASAFNDAYAKVAGSIVSFLDSDDIWHADKIQQVVDFMRMFPDGAVYQHQMDTGERLKRGGMMSADVFQLWKQWDNGIFNIADSYVGILFGPFVPTSGLTFPKSILDRVFPIPKQLVTCADAFLTRACAAYGPVYSLPATLGVWREHAQNAGGREEFDFVNFWLPKVMPALNKYYEDHNLGLKLVFEPSSRSAVPADRLLSQRFSTLEENNGGSFREQLEASDTEKGNPVGRFLRLFLSESTVRSIRRFITGRTLQGNKS